MAASRSSPASPSSASSIACVSGSARRLGRWVASRAINAASRGTAFAPAVGVEACPASPSAVTIAGRQAFSPTQIGTTTRPSTRSCRSPPPSLIE